jgi:hypothetical protein
MIERGSLFRALSPQTAQHKEQLFLKQKVCSPSKGQQSQKQEGNLEMSSRDRVTQRGFVLATASAACAVALCMLAIAERSRSPRAKVLLGAQFGSPYLFLQRAPLGRPSWASRIPEMMLADEDDSPSTHMHMEWDAKSGDLYATNPETGVVTVMHTATNETEHSNMRDPVPVNAGDPHTYFPGHQMSPRRAQPGSGCLWPGVGRAGCDTAGEGLDSVTESPQEATFRRHMKMYNKYLGMDGEPEYIAAYRIWSMFPSNSSGLEPDAEEEEEDAGPEAEEEGDGASSDEGSPGEDAAVEEGGGGGGQDTAQESEESAEEAEDGAVAQE